MSQKRNSPKNNSTQKTIAILNNLEQHLPNKLNEFYHKTITILEKLGYRVEKITFPKKLRENLQITYLILFSTELVSHLNSLQGITYGIKKNLDIPHKRSKYLGDIVKQRLLMGAYFLEQPQLVEKARKMRYLVNE